MDTLANTLINHLGGTSAVAKMLEAPMSTVHSWRKNGIPQSRMAHLRLAARAIGNPIPDDVDELSHASPDALDAASQSTGQTNDLSGGERSAA